VAGRIPEDTIADVRERTDIVQIIGQHVELKRSGANFMGLCPFHDEKTPSFSVNAAKQFYHCFGCHESGDVISFMMKVEGRRFSEVVEDLAGRAGIEIQFQKMSPARAKEEARRKSDRQRGLDLNKRIAELYRELLLASQGKPARDYLKQRGIGDTISDTFQLGFAPQDGSSVTRFIQQQQVKGEKIPLHFAEKLGLVARRRNGPGHYDRFWNRLIFPVRGIGGDVLGFGGRKLGDGDGPKYINTPETDLYRKGEALFGIEAASGAIRKCREALLVEGNLDVIQMHQYGFSHTVAPMGTALTPRQVALLKRLAQQVVAIFDGDSAGQAAAVKSIPLLVESGLEAKIATLPQDHDPDSFLQEYGVEGMEALLQKAQPAIDFLIAHLQQTMDDSIPGKARLLERVAPVIAKLPSAVARELYAGRLASLLNIDQTAVFRAIKGDKGRSYLRSERQPPDKPQELHKLTPIEHTEAKILGLLMEHPHLLHRAEKTRLISLLTNDALRATYRAAQDMQKSTGKIDSAELLRSAPVEVRDVVARQINSGEFANEGEPPRALDDCLMQLERGRLQRELQDIRGQIARAEQGGDADTARILALRKIELER